MLIWSSPETLLADYPTRDDAIARTFIRGASC
jgi:hypothetical protein